MSHLTDITSTPAIDTNRKVFNFRQVAGYRGELFVALMIPAGEDRNVVPCGCTVNANGSYRLVFNVLYAVGDIDFAKEHGRRVIADHPTWTAGVYRAHRHMDAALVAYCGVSNV